MGPPDLYFGDRFGGTVALNGDFGVVSRYDDEGVYAYHMGCNPDVDYDEDGWTDANDNCPLTHNVDQADLDGDDIGDICDSDMDDDEVPNETDVCDGGPVDAPVNTAGRPLGDADDDCDLDLADYAAYQNCHSGSGVPPQGLSCRYVFNTDGDFDVDLVDFANFQEFFTGGP